MLLVLVTQRDTEVMPETEPLYCVAVRVPQSKAITSGTIK